MAEIEGAAEGLFAGQSTLSIMLTRRCNMSCAHCSVESGPRVRKEPADAEVLALVDEAVDSRIAGLLVTGGEPMLREQLVLEILRRAKRHGLPVAMATNGFWGKKRTAAWQKVRALKRAGLGKLTVSYDRYHAEFQGPEPALNIAGAAEWFDLPLNINITRVADDPELAALVAPFENQHHQKMRFYDVQAIGRARQLPLAELRSETSGYCNACRAPALTDDGRVTACNGPSYFVAPGSPLAIGSVREAPLKELLERHRTDPILETIRLFGPSRLLKELEGMGGAARFGLRETHSGLCDVCLDVNTNMEAVAALRERLADPRLAAERAAGRLVLDGSVASGAHAPEFVNGVAAARLWMRVGSGDEPRWPVDPEKTLGRSDFDWKQSADYLSECGVARAIHPALDDSELTRWAPRFFTAQLRKAAVREGMRELIQRDVIRRLDEALTELKTRGILLKGAALLAIDDALTGPGHVAGIMNRRAGGDVDLLVSDAVAPRLRELLLSRGFAGMHDGPRTGPHHLAPISLQGVQVELHTRIMPRFWGLPEQEMVSLARPVAGLDSLSTLDPQGMLLHALVHSTAHLFSRGLRAAWDAAWILRTFPNADLSMIGGWVNESRMPRAFWVPAGVIHSRDIVALPQSLMDGAPSDERQRRLERVAQARLFAALETAFELNPFSKNGFFMMLQDSPVGRARHLASLLGRDERESRRASARMLRRVDSSGQSSGLGFQLRQGVAQWRAFKRAVAGP